jgi:NADH:ubiquinone oxidoreductase subunit 6 (subunit J)
MYTLSQYGWFSNFNFSVNSAVNFYANDIYIFGSFLYTDFFFNFLLVGVVLLVSMIGTLVLATNK